MSLLGAASNVQQDAAGSGIRANALESGRNFCDIKGSG